jgi:hypothetical protein
VALMVMRAVTLGVMGGDVVRGGFGSPAVTGVIT